jgi:hypothetical protein
MDFIKTAIELNTFLTTAYFYIFSKNSILVKETSKDLVSIPCIEKKTIEQLNLNGICSFGTYKGA